MYDETLLRDLVHDVVQTIKRNLKVDWTEPHRAEIRATTEQLVSSPRSVSARMMPAFVGLGCHGACGAA